MADQHEHRAPDDLDPARVGSTAPTGDERPAGSDRIGEHAHSAGPEQVDEGFEEGLDSEAGGSEEEEVGRFSTGIEQTPQHSAEKEHVGRFSEGVEQAETPDKNAEGDFATGSEQIPDQH